MLEGQNKDDAALGEQIHPSLLTAEHNAAAVWDRLEKFRARGQVPVEVDIFTFGWRWPLPREIGRPASSRSSAPVSK